MYYEDYQDYMQGGGLMNNNIDPLKELKDFFGESNEPIANKEITELEEMEQETKRTGKMTGNEPWFYD